MKVLFICFLSLFLASCGSEKGSSGSSSGGDSGGDGGGSTPTVSVSIDNGALQNISASNVKSFAVSGSCSEDGQPVTVSVGGVSPTSAPSCSSGSWSVSIDVTSLNKTSGTISVTADHSSSGGQSATQASENVTNNFVCPANFVAVPSLAGYTTSSFCVMKYEAKNDGSNNAISQATGTPYVSISRNDSITKCTGLGAGYDLITNDEWQSMARNIELVASNWDTGTVGASGGLSRGHSDNSPSNALAASSNDNDACQGTGQTCDSSTWNDQRRTHRLSNGEVIWDVAGNVWEWVKDDNTVNYGTNAYLSQVTAASHTTSGSLSNGTTTTSRVAKDQFGPSGDYTSLSSSPYGGLGHGSLNYNAGAVLRGGSWYNGTLAGAFAVTLGASATNTDTGIGFRCVYRP